MQRASPFRQSIYHRLRGRLEAGPGRDDRKPGEWVEVMAEHHPAGQEEGQKKSRKYQGEGWGVEGQVRGKVPGMRQKQNGFCENIVAHINPKALSC